MAKLATLVDNFDDNSLNGTLWTASGSGTGYSTTEAGQVLNILSGTSPGEYGQCASGYYDEVSSELVVKVVPNATSTCRIYVVDSAGDGFLIEIASAANVYYDDLVTWSPGGGGWGGASHAYSGTTHAWFRIREASGTTYFDTATSSASNPPAGGDWTNRASRATHGAVDTANVKVIFYNKNAAGTQGTSTFDGVNTSTVAAATGPVYYLTTSAASGSNFGETSTSAPGTSTSATGWTVGTTAADNYAVMNFGAERLASTFGGTALPGAGGPDNTLGDCFRIGPLTGSFDAGNWAVSIPVIAVDQGGSQDGAMRVRVWQSANANGSSATERTNPAGAVQLSTVTNLTTAAAQISSGNVPVTALTMSGDYLFFQLAWRITGAGA